MLSKIKPFLLGYVRSRCVLEPLKVMVKPGYSPLSLFFHTFKFQLQFTIKHEDLPADNESPFSFATIYVRFCSNFWEKKKKKTEQSLDVYPYFLYFNYLMLA